MKIEKDIKNNNLYFVDNNEVIFKTCHIGGEFVIIKSIDKPIIITEKDDKYLYKNLSWILDNKYYFNTKLSFISNNKITWFSDQSCDIDNKQESDKVDRIVLEKLDRAIRISCYNPFCERNNIKKLEDVVAFSSAGNGFYSKNLISGNTFQNDFINSMYATIKDEYVDLNKEIVKVYKKFKVNIKDN